MGLVLIFIRFMFQDNSISHQFAIVAYSTERTPYPSSTPSVCFLAITLTIDGKAVSQCLLTQALGFGLWVIKNR